MNKNKITIEDKIKYSKAKLRNIIYYRLEIEPQLEYRYRSQLMNVLRSYRKEALRILQELSFNDSRRDWFIAITRIINPKIKSDECLHTVYILRDFFNKNTNE